jgi:hypothetical protein
LNARSAAAGSRSQPSSGRTASDGGRRGLPQSKFAFTNYGVSLGFQSVGARIERVERLNAFFAGYRSGKRTLERAKGELRKAFA